MKQAIRSRKIAGRAFVHGHPRRRRTARIYAASMALFLVALSFCLFAEAPCIPILVSARSEIADAAGNDLLGPRAAGAHIQILLARDGHLYPPDQQGRPHPQNILLHASRLGGRGQPRVAGSGRFGYAVLPKPEAGGMIFVRVFNAGSPENATRYGDSRAVCVPQVCNQVLFVEIEAADLPLSSRERPADWAGERLPTADTTTVPVATSAAERAALIQLNSLLLASRSH